MIGYTCERVSIGPFERGPVHVLFESHQNAEFPEACESDQVGSATFYRVVQSLGLDDPELVAYLNATYNLPTWLIEVEEREEEAGPYLWHHWSWGAPGQEKSTAAVMDDRDPSPTPVFVDRYFWPFGAGIGRLEIVPEREGAQVTLVSYGQLKPPMLGASGLGLFTGSGEWYPKLEAEGTFTLYKDLFCQDPWS